MRYKQIDPSLFVANRKNLTQHLKPNSLVVLNANDLMPTNGDGVMPFRQNSDLFYLSGIDQEETILILYPDAPQKAWKELLFVKETNAHIMVWEGQKHTKEIASDISGIAHIYWLDTFSSIFHTLMGQVEHVYLNTNEHTRAALAVQTRDVRFAGWCKQKYPLHRYHRLAPIMQRLRTIKSEPEINLMKEACSITERGFRKVLPCISPGIMEYELEAVLIGEFVRHGSKGFSYDPIVASGANACVLHYISNNKPCQAGETILLDVGAEYANYKADLTRIIPVNGRFTKRQRAVYEAVLRVMRQAQQLLVSSNDLVTYDQQIGAVVEQELLDLGLLDHTDIKNQSPEHPAYKKYFMHGISHHIGLDPHDAGDVHRKFEPGMVLTIEPGIYIREENLGIRLENNFVVREDGLEDLMASTPIEAEEIEELMHTV
ncbi:MAG: Xaa-Pro aminopeptidase [Amoebophilaceae bacterium]|nr:Xaa-Pro aminopeptidase [Amoebophilaceae bacterium]